MHRFGIVRLGRKIVCERAAEIGGCAEGLVCATPTAVQEDGEALERERDAARSVGIDVQETEHTELPFEPFGALVLPEQAQVQPMSVLGALARQLRERGGKIVEGCRVHDVDVGPPTASLTIHTSAGSLTAEHCVLATGTPILDRSLFFAKVQPSRSYVSAHRLLDRSPPQGMYVSVGTPSRSLRTATGFDGEQLLIVGGPSEVVGRADDTTKRIRELDRWAAEQFGNVRRVTWWAAQDYRMHSRIPFAGAMPRGGGRIFAATGYNKWGMTNAVAAALAISGEMLGGNMEWAKVLREGCMRLSGVTDALAANVEVAKYLVTGWASAEVARESKATAPAEGEGIVVSDGLSPVALSQVDGKVCRLSAVCTHLGGVLRWNTAERSWDCPLHGSRFAADGRLLEGPAVNDLPEAD